jgi:hypothetical protein
MDIFKLSPYRTKLNLFIKYDYLSDKHFTFLFLSPKIGPLILNLSIE